MLLQPQCKSPHSVCFASPSQRGECNSSRTKKFAVGAGMRERADPVLSLSKCWEPRRGWAALVNRTEFPEWSALYEKIRTDLAGGG